MSFLITFLTRKGYPASFVLLSIGAIFAICYSFQTFVLLKYRPEFKIEIYGILLLIGVLSVVGNVALYQAANNAPNPGLALAIGAGLQSGVVALLALFFLRDKLSTLQIVGLILALISIFLISIGQNQGGGGKISAKVKTVSSV